MASPGSGPSRTLTIKRCATFSASPASPSRKRSKVSEIDVDLAVVPSRSERGPSGDAGPRGDGGLAAALLPAQVGSGDWSFAGSVEHRLSNSGSPGLESLSGAGLPDQPESHRGRLYSERIRPSATLPEPVDLAIIAVPRDAVMGVVDDCAARGVRALVIITAGFAEVNAEGRKLQQSLVEKVRGYGMRMVGPNCMGLLNTDPAVRLNASFSPVFPRQAESPCRPKAERSAWRSWRPLDRLDLGLSTFVSVGNKADVSGNDLLQYWEEDPGTDVILLYLESFGNPRRFARIARRVSRRKPIVAIKSGRTKAGGRAAGSHTAALAANEVAVDALFHLTGVIRAETLEEMFDLAAALASQPLPRGRRVAIVTNAGGPAILCADVCEAGGLIIAGIL